MPSFSKKRFLILAGLLAILPIISLAVKTQRLEIRKIAQGESPVKKEINQTYPLEINKPVYHLSISGKVDLNEEAGFIRVILIDRKQNEYLVYEAYPLIVDKNSFSVDHACEETCLLDSVIPDSFRIDGYAASIKIENVSFSEYLQETAPGVESSKIPAYRKESKKKRDDLKIQKLNERIKKKGLKWIAGETPVSKLSYSEKKKLFTKPDGTPVDKLPNLQGFEYYKGGIFEIAGAGEPPMPTPATESSLLPSSWDWRRVHGENWNTPVRDQGVAGTCWVHARLGALESAINLYFNQHLNVDLSEQMMVDCDLCNERPICMGLGAYVEECLGENWCYPGDDYCVLAIHGIPDEACDPYVGREPLPGPVVNKYCNLDFVCPDWQRRIWKNTSFHDYKFGSYIGGTPNCPHQTLNLDENGFKQAIIQGGPLDSGLFETVPEVMPAHGMVLEGYETDLTDNKTVWIFKNSWGSNWGEGGYAKIKTSLDKIKVGSLPLGPIVLPENQDYWPAGFDGQIKCVDKDGDGYCNWGISGEKPSLCPASCQQEKDCDDSNPSLGPFDANLDCAPLAFLPLHSGWNKIVWSDVPSYPASAALKNIDSDCGGGTAVAISRKRKDWWKDYVKNYGGENFNLQNGQNYFINVSKGCNWVP